MNAILTVSLRQKAIFVPREATKAERKALSGTASLLVANTVITLYTLLGIELEEAKLVDEFGDEYRRYRETVPKLLPFRRARQ